ncbi:MAG: histidine kinase [Verrucomicrobiales bacterium]|nr:histidine kinase [Verrucomicrobiales bacterium]
MIGPRVDQAAGMTTGGPHPAGTTIGESDHGWLRATGITLLIAAVFGLVQASQIVLTSVSFGRTLPWSVALVNGLTDTLLWTPLVAPIYWVSRRFPFSPARWPTCLTVHLLAAILAVTLYSTANTAVNQWLIPDSMQIMRFFRGPRPPPEPPRDETVADPNQRPTDTVTNVFRPPEHSHGPDDANRGPNPGRAHPRDRGPGEPTFLEKTRLVLSTRWFLHLLTYGMIAAAWEWTAQQRRLRAGERQAQELSRQLAEARLQALRMQLNPHFLFNTLNAIATLVHRSPHVADEMISSLSDFLRLTLASPNTAQVPLRKELEFARRYLDIEKVRFGDRLTIVEAIEPDSLGVDVPTLLLQPLLENAIRHGIEPNEQRGEIRLSARRDTEFLVLNVSDTGQGLSASAPTSRSGIGLANTRARLKELHGEAATLSMSARPGSGLDVEVRVPWKIAENHP